MKPGRDPFWTLAVRKAEKRSRNSRSHGSARRSKTRLAVAYLANMRRSPALYEARPPEALGGG